MDEIQQRADREVADFGASVAEQRTAEAVAADAQVRIAKELIRIAFEATAIRYALEKIANKGSGPSAGERPRPFDLQDH